MSELLVIGICGKAESGKDTVAKLLVSEFEFFRVSLGDGPRSALSDLDGPTWEIRKETEKAGKSSSRWSPQTIGNECRHEILGATHHWATNALIKIRYLVWHHCKPRLRIVIPDIRHEEEIDRLREVIEVDWGGQFVLWKTCRFGHAGLTGDAAAHSSEQQIDYLEADKYLENTSSLADLRSLATYHATELLNARKAAEQQ